MNMQQGPEMSKPAAIEAQESPSTRKLVGRVFGEFSSTDAHQAMLAISRNPNPSNEEIRKVSETLAQHQKQAQEAQDTVAANYFAGYWDGLRRDYPGAFPS